jgi:hypothetical protein
VLPQRPKLAKLREAHGHAAPAARRRRLMSSGLQRQPRVQSSFTAGACRREPDALAPARTPDGLRRLEDGLLADPHHLLRVTVAQLCVWARRRFKAPGGQKARVRAQRAPLCAPAALCALVPPAGATWLPHLARRRLEGGYVSTMQVHLRHRALDERARQLQAGEAPRSLGKPPKAGGPT